MTIQNIRTIAEFQAFTAKHLGEDGSWLDTDLRVELINNEGSTPAEFWHEPGELQLKIVRLGVPSDGSPGAVVAPLAVVELGQLMDAAGRDPKALSAREGHDRNE